MAEVKDVVETKFSEQADFKHFAEELSSKKQKESHTHLPSEKRGKYAGMKGHELRGNFLVCCLPFVEDKNTDTRNLLKISSISVGFSVLLGILNYLTMADRLTCLIDLDNYLTLSMPFGTPSDTEFCSLPYLQKFHSQKFSKRVRICFPDRY
ncbi:AP-5 complex subunit mu-1 [Trichonephila clavipes]|nr:AP-5 complex subunit mu-1 [Trichonephila clavipes]